MHITSLRSLCRILAGALILVAAGCGGGADGSSSTTYVRLLNLSDGYDSLDLYSNNGDDETDTRLFSGVTEGSLTSYASLKGDTYTLKFRKSGTTGDLYSWAANLAGGSYMTLVTTGTTNQFAVGAIGEDTDAPNTGYTSIQVLNVSSAGSVDVYLTGSTDSLDDVTATTSATGAGSQSGIVTVASGTYRMRILSSGSKVDVRLNVPSVVLPSAGVLSFIVTDTDGGVLVNAIMLPKQGQPTIFENTSNAQFRVLNVSSGYSPLDVYTNASGDDTDVQQFTGVSRGVATSYKSLAADTYTLKFRRSGAAGNLLSVSSTLSQDRHVTYIAHGASNRFAVTALDDEIAAPDSGYTAIQILNTATVDVFDVYLTSSDDSLNDVSPVVGSLASGALSTLTTARSGTYRLRVASSGSKTDVRLDVPAVSLADSGVLSIILTDTAGGVLASAVLLPQQAEPIILDNNNVRIRGAVGLSTGSTSTVRVASTDIVARRSARSYISDSYTILPSGNVPVIVFVDDVQVASGMVALQPGGDYTLMISDANNTPQVALISDNNFASTTHQSKIRLLNGASGLAVPLTLAVDYSPVAEFISVGDASEVAELAPGTDIRLDVLNTNTLATVLTRESVTLLADGVYTLFVAGGGASAVSGTLRKDR